MTLRKINKNMIDDELIKQVNDTTQGLADKVEKVNGVSPIGGNVTIAVPEVDVSKLATKAEIASIGNASPKGTYATLAALQTAHPAGTTGIYVVTADGKWYYWNSSVWSVGGLYQSAGIEDKAITKQKISDNLFDDMGFVGYPKPNITWELGTLNGTGTVSPSTTRIVSSYIPIVSGIVIGSLDKALADYSFSTYDAIDNFSTSVNTSWKYGVPTTIAGDYKYIKIAMRYTDNAVITDVGDLSRHFLFNVDSVSVQTPKSRFTEVQTEIDLIKASGGKQLITQNTLDASVKSIMHRGYSTDAPENTLSAYILAKRMGFSYVEMDIRVTSDGIPVLLHDTTIDRTSTGTGAINSLTLAQARMYDYGAWKDVKYTGEKIPTLEEALILCRKLNLHAYLDVGANLAAVMATVKKAGMLRNVTWLWGNVPNLQDVVLASDKFARIGYINLTMSSEQILAAKSLKTDFNDVFVYTNYNTVTKALAEQCFGEGLQFEVWTWGNNVDMVVPTTELGVSGICSDSLNVTQILNASQGVT